MADKVLIQYLLIAGPDFLHSADNRSREFDTPIAYLYLNIVRLDFPQSRTYRVDRRNAKNIIPGGSPYIGIGAVSLGMYRVHFKWKEKDIQLTAKSLDLTHPYFVSIKDLVFPAGQKLIINPSEDDIRKAFKDSDHLMIPFQSVRLIEELTEKTVKRSRVMPFGLVDGDRNSRERQGRNLDDDTDGDAQTDDENEA